MAILPQIDKLENEVKEFAELDKKYKEKIKEQKERLTKIFITEMKYKENTISDIQHKLSQYQKQEAFLIEEKEDMLKKYSKNEDFYTVFNFSTPFFAAFTIDKG